MSTDKIVDTFSECFKMWFSRILITAIDEETALEAARREGLEEIGITIDQLQLVHVVDRQGPETEFYVFVFKPLNYEGVPFNAEINKCDDISWFPLTNLPENIITAHKQAIELSQKGIGYSQHGWNTPDKV